MKREKRLDLERVRRNFSCHAEQYDRYAVVQKRVVKGLLERIGARKVPAGEALEVGTGTGELTRGLLQICPQVRPVVSDLAHGMTRLASERLPGIAAIDADAHALPVRGGALSLVYSSSVYQWVEDLPLAFAEAARVLAPGGLFACALFAERTLWELREAHRKAASERRGHSHVQSFPTESGVRGALEGAAFTSIELSSCDEIDLHPDVPSLLRALKRIGAGNAAAERPEGLSPRRVIQRMIELYEEKHRRPDGRIPATYHVVYVLARKRLPPLLDQEGAGGW